MNLTYSPLPEFDDEEAKRILKTGSVEEMSLLSLSVGEYHHDWKKAQDICIALSNHKDEEVRANAALGLAYIARTKNRLEKHIVKPVLLNLFYSCVNYKWRIIDAITDINTYLGWNLAEKAISKYKDSQNESK